MVRRLLVDIAPLRTSPDFRRLWWGSAVSGVGAQMTVFAVALQVWLMTHSSLAVGGIGLAAAVPAILLGLLSGSLVDAVDRRRLVLVTSALLTAISAVLTVQAFLEWNQLWLIYALLAAESVVASVSAPARKTFLPRLVPVEQLPAALALTMLTTHLTVLAGPLLGGVVTATGGLKLCYLADTVSFLAAMYGVARLPPMRPTAPVSRPGPRAVADGVRFLRRSPVLSGALLADVDATLLAMPIALFPAINAERFDGSPRSLGLLTAALGIGGLIGSGLSGPLGRVTRQGRAMLAAVVVWGLALAAFGLVDGLVATVGCLVVAGVADVSSVVLRSTILQLGTPDELRGRINATEYVVGAVVPQLGGFRAGVVASLTSPAVSAVAGGLAATAGVGVIAVLFPALVRFRPDPAAPATAGSGTPSVPAEGTGTDG